MVRYLVVFFILSLTIPVQASKKFASPNGSASNSGISPDLAWTLNYALGNSSPLVPGDTLILTDGIFEGNFTSTINGTSDKPIVILAQNEGKAIIDVGKQRTSGTGLIINGSYTWFVGIHITSSSLIRKSDASNGFATVTYESGISVFGDNNKIINCWIYDVVGGGLELWRSGLNLEVYGSIIFNNGSQADTRGTGHGMYIQHNQPDKPKVIENNFVFQNASQGINIYTTDPVNSGVIARRNVSFNTGVIATFNQSMFRPPHNLSIGSQNNESFEMSVESNLFYTDLQGGRLNSNLVSNVTLGRTFSPNRDIKFNDNILFGGGNMVELQPLSGLIFKRNRLFNVHGNFLAFLGTSASFPNSNWDLNEYRNLANTSKPFQGLNFSDWKSSFSPFDASSSFYISPTSSKEVLITQNKYDSLRFHVSILAFSDSEIISLDFSEFEEFRGAEYEIRDVQNPFDQNQKITGTFGGSTISFPMTWTKSLQPKGNMPFQVVHTDLTFGTFLLKFKELEQDQTVFPEVKNSVTLFLSNEGTVKLTPEIFLAKQPNEPYTYSSSSGFDFECSDLGENKISITLKNSRTGGEKIVPFSVWIVDNLPPSFGASNRTYSFDPVVGKISLSVEDFGIVDIKENCTSNYSFSLSKNKISCEDIYQNSESPIWEFPVIITMTDFSGNSNSKTVKAIIGNVVESKKISISPESGSQFLVGQNAEIRLGEEFEYSVEGWYRNGQLILGEKGKALLIDDPGTYWAKLLPIGGGCSVESKKTEIFFQALPFGQIKEKLELNLGPDGKAELSPQQVFVTWPLLDPTLIVTLNKSIFNCENLGENEVFITIKKPSGATWERKTTVLVRDLAKPILVPKNINLELDVTKGVVEISPQSILSEFGDNCSLKSLTINKNRFTCEDLGKEFSVGIRAEDKSGNVTEKVAIVNIIRLESEKVAINGKKEICAGEKSILELSSSKAFEVVRWRRNGTEIQGQTGKTLEVTESGKYHAVIRYIGGCLSETVEFEVKVNPLPSGEIAVDGNILRAPEGNFGYKWFRNGEQIEGANSRTLTVQMMGEYSVELTSGAGCKSRLKAVTLTISGIGGRPVNHASELKIYPNPASDRVTLELPDGVLISKPEILVFSPDGKDVTSVVQITVLSDFKVEIILNRLANGTYIIRIIGENQKTYFGKLVVVN